MEIQLFAHGRQPANWMASRYPIFPLAKASYGIQVRRPLGPSLRSNILPLTHQNIEIFLPSYVDCDYVPLENQREPVHEIILSDEESRQMLPQ